MCRVLAIYAHDEASYMLQYVNTCVRLAIIERYYLKSKHIIILNNFFTMSTSGCNVPIRKRVHTQTQYYWKYAYNEHNMERYTLIYLIEYFSEIDCVPVCVCVNCVFRIQVRGLFFSSLLIHIFLILF